MHDLALLSKMFDQFQEAIYIVDKERQILYYNPVAVQLSGFSKEEMEQSFCYDNKLNHIDDEGTNLCINGCPLLIAIKEDRVSDHFVYMHHKEGHRVRLHVRTIPHHTPTGTVDGAIEVFSDVSSKNLVLQELKIRKALTYIDSLTDVFNRHYIKYELPHILQQNAKTPIAVAFLDVDEFKHINDTYGHAFGDAVLEGVAKTLSLNVKTNDIVVRYGGDEFVIIFIGIEAVALDDVITRLLTLLKGTIIRRLDKEHPVHVSVGVTMRLPEESIEDTIERADIAMYVSKRAGKDRYTIR